MTHLVGVHPVPEELEVLHEFVRVVLAVQDRELSEHP